MFAPDLRGYGDSDKPADGFDKRTMASDLVGLMSALGHARFRLAGHDRGARVSYRLALDHPEAVEQLILMDIVRTGVMFANVDATTARRNWRWFFFQLADLPEMWLSSNIPEYLAWSFRNATYNPAAIEPEAVDEYVRVFSLPGTIRSCLEDYRAGAAVDSPRDLEDMAAGRKITAPTLDL